jgi:hypothetical protein
MVSPHLLRSGQVSPSTPNPELGIHDQQVFGQDARRCSCGLGLEQGSGALSANEQCLRNHLPYLAQTRGREFAEAQRRKIWDAQRRAAVVQSVGMTTDTAAMTRQ